MSYRIATRNDWLLSLIVILGLSALLAVGFIPTSREFFRWLAHLNGSTDGSSLLFHLCERGSFPLLAALFLISLPRTGPRARRLPYQRRNVIEICFFPIVIGLLFGLYRNSTSFLLLWTSQSGQLDLFWYFLFVPIGEEVLFRGWVYEIVDRGWRGAWATATNPLPLAVWMSSVSFAIWHVQNLGQDPGASVLWQMLYTFFTGMWLGYLRWRTGSLLPCIAGHIAINLASNLV